MVIVAVVAFVSACMPSSVNMTVLLSTDSTGVTDLMVLPLSLNSKLVATMESGFTSRLKVTCTCLQFNAVTDETAKANVIGTGLGVGVTIGALYPRPIAERVVMAP